MSWLLILLASLLAWLWWDGLGAKEIAHASCQRLCRERDVLFLDDTVALSRLSLRRDRSGTLRIFRRFNFEFTSDGELRYQGYVDMLGSHVIHTEMDAYRIH
jgi:hypothetical protein